MTKETINLVSLANQAYYVGLRVSFCSAARYASRNVALRFYFFDGGISPESFEELQRLLGREHPDVTVTRIPVTEKMFKGCPVWKGNRMAYATFLLPQCLPNVDDAICFGSDFLWCADVAKLWVQRDPKWIVQAVRDGWYATENKEREWFHAQGLPFPEGKYFCTGVQLLNLAQMRKENITEKLFAFVRKHPTLLFADQTAMNVVCYGHSNLLDPRWQTFSLNLTAQIVADDFVVHYAGDAPWRRDFWAKLITDPVLLWYRMNDSFLGVKPGTTIKKDFSWWQRIYKRGLALLLTKRCGRNFLYWVCRITGRGSYCRDFDTYVHDLKISAVLKRLGI